MGEAQRQRLAPEARKVLLLDAAQATFASQGYAHTALAEIADSAGVSKTLLYHYYPEGRPELYREVIERLGTLLLNELRAATSAPLSASRRLSLLIDALLTFFEEEPAAHRLVLVEPWGTGDATVVGQAAGVRMRLASEVARLLAASDRPVAEITAGTNAAIAVLVQVVELQATGALGPAGARALAGAFVEGGLSRLGLI